MKAQVADLEQQLERVVKLSSVTPNQRTNLRERLQLLKQKLLRR